MCLWDPGAMTSFVHNVYVHSIRRGLAMQPQNRTVCLANDTCMEIEGFADGKQHMQGLYSV
jgi:hypothetical protein